MVGVDGWSISTEKGDLGLGIGGLSKRGSRSSSSSPRAAFLSLPLLPKFSADGPGLREAEEEVSASKEGRRRSCTALLAMLWSFSKTKTSDGAGLLLGIRLPPASQWTGLVTRASGALGLSTQEKQCSLSFCY